MQKCFMVEKKIFQSETFSLFLIHIGLGSLQLHFLTLEEIYNAATEKITQYKCNSLEEYAKNNYKVEVR